eukprot:358919-Chlamydomonas_euryale.AAC.2
MTNKDPKRQASSMLFTRGLAVGIGPLTLRAHPCSACNLRTDPLCAPSAQLPPVGSAAPPHAPAQTHHPHHRHHHRVCSA